MNAKQNGKISQSLMIAILILITVLVSLAIWLSSKKKLILRGVFMFREMPNILLKKVLKKDMLKKAKYN